MNKLNNKGFTLIEILAVVAIITIISLIAVPSVLSIINTGKDNSYEILVENINAASKNLFEEIEHMNGIEGINIETQDENTKYIEVDLKTLVKYGFLSGDNNRIIINPKNNKDIGDCRIKVNKVTNDNKITYIIEDLTDNDYCPSTIDYAI